MKHFVLGGVLILSICSSCSVYQYNTMSSDIAGKDNKSFTFENDTLQIRYSFPGGRAAIEVFNKSEKPLYIDWSRSGLIVDGETRPYRTNTTTVDLVTREYSALTARSQSYTTGVMTNETAVSFIPPNSGLTNPLFNLPHRPETVTFADATGESKLYTYETSPLKFRSYILASVNQDFSDPIALDHTFWLSERRQSKQAVPLRPKEYTWSKEILTEGGNAAAGILTIIVAIPLVVLYTYSQ